MFVDGRDQLGLELVELGTGFASGVIVQFKRILVGVDFSDGSDTAVAWAMDLASERGANVVLTYVADAPAQRDNFAPGQEYQSFLATELARDREKLADLVARSRKRGVEVSPSIVGGIPAQGVLDASEELGADLIVLGTSGRGRIKRLFVGSVAERVGRASMSSVLIARPNRAGGSYRNRVVVATDFSPYAERALHAALEVVALGGAVELFHTWDFPAAAGQYFGKPDSPVHRAIADAIATQGRDLVAKHPSGRATITFEHANQPARDGILQRLEQAPADLVVVGTHGRRGPGRWLLGSVAEAIVRRAPCSVLVAR